MKIKLYDGPFDGTEYSVLHNAERYPDGFWFTALDAEGVLCRYEYQLESIVANIDVVLSYRYDGVSFDVEDQSDVEQGNVENN